MIPVAVDTVFFAFESDFVVSLRCIPMIVRYKLDTCGIKLKLPEWVKLSLAEKDELATRPCCTAADIVAYRTYLSRLVQDHCGHPASELGAVDAVWDHLSNVPDDIQQKAREWHRPPLTLQQWIDLDTLQRFALVKLSRSGHEGRNFPRALDEFGLS